LIHFYKRDVINIQNMDPVFKGPTGDEVTHAVRCSEENIKSL